jgi:hypothetical protein
MKAYPFFSLLFTLLVTLLVTSCANVAERPSLEQRLTDMGLEVSETSSGIPRYRVNGWIPIDDLNLIITAGVDDKYLVRLSSPCLGLDGAFQIGFTTPTGRLDRFESILVRGPGLRRERCGIRDISNLVRITP